jgi:hypothetical protein
LDSRDFYTIKPPWIGDLRTLIKKKSKSFRFGYEFEVFFRETFEVAHAEYAIKNILGARSKTKIADVGF